MSPKLKILVYQARDGWRWRILCGARVLAFSANAYSRRPACLRTLERLISALRCSDFLLEVSRPRRPFTVTIPRS